MIDDVADLLVAEHGYRRTKQTVIDDGGPREAGEPQASVERIAAALAVIPNNEDWDGWNNIGMATWRATGGSEAGFVAFDAWSKKSSRYDADTTAAKWAAYFKSPPTHIGAGTIFLLADQASPIWWLDYRSQITRRHRSRRRQRLHEPEPPPVDKRRIKLMASAGRSVC